jgi:hypothetical protein
MVKDGSNRLFPAAKAGMPMFTIRSAWSSVFSDDTFACCDELVLDFARGGG